MNEKINEKVSVKTVYSSINGSVFPYLLCWKEKIYRIKKVGLHHVYRQGKTLLHIFSVTDGSLFFRLCLNTENLHWKLEEVSDGMTD